MCHGNGKVQSFEIVNNTRDKKGFITYNPKHGINNMKKHVENEYAVDLAQYTLEVVVVKEFGDGHKKAKKCSNPFLCSILHCDYKCVFLSQKYLVNEHLPTMLTRMMERYVVLTIAKHATTIASFDLRMSKSRCDTFAFVINFIDDQWVPCHVTIAFFEPRNTSSVVLTIQMKSLLVEFNITNIKLLHM
jgi:hypothetical protein